MFGIDEFYSNLLLEAKSPEEIRNILYNKFVKANGVPEDIFNYVLDIDPTKKKSYTQWTLMQWPNKSELIKSLIENKQLNEIFSYFKKRAGDGLDLTKISLDKAVVNLPSYDPILWNKPNDESGEYKIIYNTPEWVIAVPHSYEASKYLSTGCKWCTANAYGNGEYYYKEYTRKGNLYINFDKRRSEVCPVDNKEYPYKRYQLMFEEDEFKDSRNESFSLDEIDMPEEVIDFYGEISEDYKDKLLYMDNLEALRDRYNQERCNRAIYNADGLIVIPEYKHDDFHISEYDDYYVYNWDDITDPIGSDPVDKEKLIHNLYDSRHLVIFNQKTLNRVVFCNSNNTYWSCGGELLREWVIDTKIGKIGFVTTNSHNVILSHNSKDYALVETFNDAVNINNIKDITPDVEIPGYNYGVFLQVEYDNNIKGVLYVDMDNGYINIRILKDIPDGNDFTFIEKNGKFYIHSKIQDYVVDGSIDCYNEDDFYIVTDLNCQGRKFMCLYKTQSSSKRIACILDGDTNKIILNNISNFDSNIFKAPVILYKSSNDNLFYIYDIDTEEHLFNGLGFNSIEGLNNKFLYLLCKRGEDNYIVWVKEKVISQKFTHVLSIGRYVDSVLVTTKELESKNLAYILILPTREFKGPFNNGNFNGNGFLLSKDVNGRKHIINCANGASISEINDDETIYQLRCNWNRPRGYRNDIFLFKTPDNRYNYFSIKDGLLSEDGFDGIVKDALRNNGGFLVVSKGDRLFILENYGSARPEPNGGFNKNVINDIEHQYGNFYQIKVTYQNKHYILNYDIAADKVISYVDLENKNNQYDENGVREIDNLIRYKPQMINESFKSFWDRLNNL